MKCYVLQWVSRHGDDPLWVRYPQCIEKIVPLTDDSRAAWKFKDWQVAQFLAKVPMSVQAQLLLREAYFSTKGDIHIHA